MALCDGAMHNLPYNMQAVPAFVGLQLYFTGTLYGLKHCISNYSQSGSSFETLLTLRMKRAIMSCFSQAFFLPFM